MQLFNYFIKFTWGTKILGVHSQYVFLSLACRVLNRIFISSQCEVDILTMNPLNLGYPRKLNEIVKQLRQTKLAAMHFMHGALFLIELEFI